MTLEEVKAARDQICAQGTHWMWSKLGEWKPAYIREDGHFVVYPILQCTHCGHKENRTVVTPLCVPPEKVKS